jgi:hypothetical protein
LFLFFFQVLACISPVIFLSFFSFSFSLSAASVGGSLADESEISCSVLLLLHFARLLCAIL